MKSPRDTTTTSTRPHQLLPSSHDIRIIYDSHAQSASARHYSTDQKHNTRHLTSTRSMTYLGEMFWSFRCSASIHIRPHSIKSHTAQASRTPNPEPQTKEMWQGLANMALKESRWSNFRSRNFLPLMPFSERQFELSCPIAILRASPCLP